MGADRGRRLTGIVMGTQAADTDSVVSAITYAYSLRHRKDDPMRAVPLLEYPRERIDLRPEVRRSLVEHR